jgi:16S rRNA (guanine527-N7)-methyltransferase
MEDVIQAYRRLLEPHIEDAEACMAMARYGELLERWSAVHNLVSFGSRQELVRRHLLECAGGASAMASEGRLLDVGSGAGFPGVPLLVVRRGFSGVLLEPRSKRWSFLRRVVRALDLDAEVVRCRYQDWQPDEPAFDVVCARAIGAYESLLGWAKERLTPTGQLLLWVNVETADALQDLAGWRVVSSPLADRKGGRLVRIQPCFT